MAVNIVTPLAAGDDYAGVKSRLVTLAETFLGSGQASGGNAPSTWADMRTKLNTVAAVLGLTTISNGDSGSSVRTKINAINDVTASTDMGNLYARISTPPTDPRAILQAQLIYSLKAASVWSKLDALYLFAAADSQAARQNWITNLYNATAVSSPAFVADQGYTGDGSASYVDTGFNPTTASSPKFTQNAAHLGIWSRTNLTNAGGADAGSSGSGTWIGRSGSTSGLAIGRVNTTTSVLSAAGAYPKHAMWSRNDASSFKGYAQGVSAQTGSAASTTLANANFRALSAQSSFNINQLAAFHFGGSVSDADALAIYNALNTYLTAIGAA